MPVNNLVEALKNRGFRDAIIIDTEYIDRQDGNHVTPVCMAAKSLFTGRIWKCFADECPTNPLPMDDVLFMPRQQNLWADSGSGRRPSV